MAIRTNRERLVVTAVTGEAAPALMSSGLYDVSVDGEPLILPSVGGINPNVRVGDSAFGFEADHIEPGVSTRHANDKTNLSYNVLACIGNEAMVISGDAKGATGRVTGKHGGIEHVMIDFTPDVMRQMAIGDKVQVWGCGLGLSLLDAPDVKAFNSDPDFLDAWGITAHDGHVHARVARLVPASVMGSGLGRSTVVRGDYDIQTFDDTIAEKYGLRELRLGDIVAVVDADNSFGRIYRTGAMTVGVVVHGASHVAGHGPGMTTLLTSKTGAIEIEIDRSANLASILKLR
jgi:ribosomal protein L24